MPSDRLDYYLALFASDPTYREAYFTSNAESAEGRAWGTFQARCSRYELYWGLYEGTAYRKDTSKSAEARRDALGLYTHTRSIYSPSYRIGEFWASHLMGGPLDSEAGDGKVGPSALPIVTDNPAVRKAIAKLWHDSNWPIHKDTFTRFGAVLGDVGLMVVDDPVNRRVSLKVIHPGTIKEMTADGRGNVRGYVIAERRRDPLYPGPPDLAPEVVYTEVAERTGESVHYMTFRELIPYDWRGDDAGGVGPEWSEDYGFVPLVVANHRVMGTGWGWSELHPSLAKLQELDDNASKLSDQVRKIVDARWAFIGVSESDLTLSEDRTKAPALYLPQGSSVQPLVAPLDLASAIAHVKSLLDQVEQEHPELAADDVGPASSGTARRVARQKVEAMVIGRRAGYDDALVRAHKMALSIGAMREYPGYEAFTAESYANGDLDHSIGDRPVFALDTADRLAEEQLRSAVVAAYVTAGMPLLEALRRAGCSDEELAGIAAERERETRRTMDLSDRQAEQQSRLRVAEAAAHADVQAKVQAQAAAQSQPQPQPTSGQPVAGAAA